MVSARRFRGSYGEYVQDRYHLVALVRVYSLSQLVNRLEAEA
jgi:hypothetical protein